MIKIDIDELRLPGLNLRPGEAELVRREVIRHLHLLIETQGLPPSAGPYTLPSLRLPPETIGRQRSPWALGRQIAQAVYRHLQQGSDQRS